MSFINLASAKSLWRGLEYYGNKRVLSVKQIDKNIYESMVQGRRDEPYHVQINLEHPRASKCTCSFADGRHVVCKHMVAAYFTVCPEEAKRIIEEEEEFEREEEQRWQEEYKKIERYVNSLTKQQLREELIAYIMADAEHEYWGLVY